MNVLFDGRFTAENEVRLSFTDRGFQYGDGIFETIICQREAVRFLPLHWARFTRGMKVLDLSMPKWLDLEYLESAILKLVQLERLETARVKVLVWRREGGLYTPTQHSAHLLIMALQHRKPPQILETAGFSQTVRITRSPTSSFKTLSSVTYVLAGMEKNQRNLDELILLDHNDCPAECTAANLFWIKNNRFYTPPLDSGCIDGIRRRYIIERLAGENPVSEVSISIQELLEADQVFTCNVAGIGWIRNIQDRHFELNQADRLERDFNLND